MRGLAFLGLLLLSASSVHAENIAFFYALDADFQTLKAQATVARQPVKVGQHSIQVLTLGKHRVYAVKMGSGAVETATSAEALLARFQCELGISLGPVGALADELEVGKWYRIASVTSYQKGSWTASGFQLHKEATVELKQETLPKLSIPAQFQNAKSISVASGEVFVVSSSYRQQLREQTHADAVDMNLFGLLTVCQDHHVPLLNWRIVSDRADDNAGDDFRKFTQSYDGAGGKAVAELIRNLPPNPNSPESYPELQKLLQPTPHE